MPILIPHISPYKKEPIMTRVKFKYVDAANHVHLIDLYFKLEMMHVMQRIMFEHDRGSFNTVVSV
jgi:hypothetical protein